MECTAINRSGISHRNGQVSFKVKATTPVSKGQITTNTVLLQLLKLQLDYRAAPALTCLQMAPMQPLKVVLRRQPYSQLGVIYLLQSTLLRLAQATKTIQTSERLTTSTTTLKKNLQLQRTKVPLETLRRAWCFVSLNKSLSQRTRILLVARGSFSSRSNEQQQVQGRLQNHRRSLLAKCS